MSWLYSRALVEAFSEANCLDGEQSVPSSGNPTPQAYLPPDRMTAFSRPSRFGMTFAPLTADIGEALLTSYLAAFPAKPIPQQRLAKIQLTTFGRKCGEWWQMSLLGTYLPKTSAELQLNKRRKTSSKWVIKSNVFPYQRRTWAATTLGSGFGYVATPTATANQSSPSMMKHAGCRNFVKVFGQVTPENYEYLMAWPPGWTDLKPLGTDKSHSALQQPGDC